MEILDNFQPLYPLSDLQSGIIFLTNMIYGLNFLVAAIDRKFQEMLEIYFPSSLKEFLLVIISMRLMWIGLKILTSITDFLNNNLNKN